jgi:hypothetical protein
MLTRLGLTSELQTLIEGKGLKIGLRDQHRTQKVVIVQKLGPDTSPIRSDGEDRQRPERLGAAMFAEVVRA